MHHIIPWLHALFIHYGSLGIAIPAFAQELFLPVPATLIMLSAGFFLFWGKAITAASLTNLFFMAALPLTLGLTLGSIINYAIFYTLGKPAITRFGKYIRLDWDDIIWAENKLKKGYSDELAFFFIRVVPIIPSAILSTLAGVTRWRFWPYVTLTFIGVLISSYIFTFIGWQAGKLYVFYAREIGQFDTYIFIALVVVALAWFGYKKILSKSK